MLDVDPQKRPSTGQVLKHPWMTSPNPLSTQLVVGTKVQDVKVNTIHLDYITNTVRLYLDLWPFLAF